MRRLAIGILCGTAFLASSCSQPSDNQTPEAANAGGEVAAAAEYFTVRAGPVSNAKISALSGNFQILKVAAPNGIPSDRRGGACFVFGAADLGYAKMATKSCTKNADCYTGEGESAAYCHTETRTCWAKPSANDAANKLCNKGKIFPTNDLNPIPADAPAGSGPIDVSEWVKPGAKVRVVACVGKPWSPPPPPLPPCGRVDTPDRIEVMGPVATIKS